MSDPEQPPSSFEVDNKAPNQGAQGVFHGPVYFSISSSFELADYPIDSIDWNKEPLKRLRATPDQPPNSESINYLRSSFFLHSYISPDEVFERVHLNEFTGRTWLEQDLDAYLVPIRI